MKNVTITLQEDLEAWEIQDSNGFCWWDCMLLASALLARCSIFLSEDLQHGRTVDDMTVLNPFKLDPTLSLSR
jgi:predicted nucleic acid-binding protein